MQTEVLLAVFRDGEPETSTCCMNKQNETGTIKMHFMSS